MTLPIRQGDVCLIPGATLPAGCTEIPNDKGRIVLAYGEVTGHAHAIADHICEVSQMDELKAQVGMSTPTDFSGRQEHINKEIYEAAIARAKYKARLWRAPNAERFLEVRETVNLTHEEHTPHALLPGIYKLPTQKEYTPAALRRVED